MAPGPTFENIKDYLASFGSRWALLDVDPASVIEKEERWILGDPNPAEDTDLIKAVLGNWDGLSYLTLATLFNGIAGNSRLASEYKTLHKSHKEKVNRAFQRARREYRFSKKNRHSHTDIKSENNQDSPRSVRKFERTVIPPLTTPLLYSPND
jgi:hypothetical protein